MKPKMFLVGAILLIISAVSLIGLKNDRASAQESSKSISEEEIADKLDRLLANQDQLLDTLGRVEQELTHEIRVRCTQ